MSTGKVLVTCPPAIASADQYMGRLTEHGLEVVLAEVVQQLSEEQLLALVPDVDGMIAGDDQLTGLVLESAPRLRVIVRWGVGIDNVDLAAAARLGIRVVNTPGVFGAEVADVAIGYLILLARHIHLVDRDVREGGWPKPPGHSLAGRRVGIVGLGSIGRNVARRALALGMIVSGTDIAAAAREAAAAEGVTVLEFQQLLADSDVLVLCCPQTADNRRMMNADTFASMRKGSWLVNVSRGGLVDEDSLVAALRSGRLAAAALDVFETEPLPAASRLRGFEQVVLGTHNASNTVEAVQRVNELAVDLMLKGMAEVLR